MGTNYASVDEPVNDAGEVIFESAGRQQGEDYDGSFDAERRTAFESWYDEEFPADVGKWVSFIV
jgi:hypothetical protein